MPRAEVGGPNASEQALASAPAEAGGTFLNLALDQVPVCFRKAWGASPFEGSVEISAPPQGKVLPSSFKLVEPSRPHVQEPASAAVHDLGLRRGPSLVGGPPSPSSEKAQERAPASDVYQRRTRAVRAARVSPPPRHFQSQVTAGAPAMI